MLGTLRFAQPTTAHLRFQGLSSRTMLFRCPPRRPPARTEESRLFPGCFEHPPYLLRRSSRRRTLALRVGEAGDIVVNAPLRLAQRDIDTFLARHTDWIKERLAQAHTRVFHWQDGAQLPWLGGTLRLVLLPAAGKPVLRLEQDHLLCQAPPEAAAALVTRWFSQQARALLAERLAHHATRAGLPLPPMRLSNARTRWGSLSPRGVVSLNWRLIKAPPEALDYVICHELAHFRQRNHSAAFWREVAILFPDYARVRAQLKQNGRGYFAF